MITFPRRWISRTLSVFVFLGLLIPLVPTRTALTAQASPSDSPMQTPGGDATAHPQGQAGIVAVQRDPPVRMVHTDGLTA
jgi:hypothetical protein